jgi:hypothetical protein
MKKLLSKVSTEKLLRIACALGLVALPLMVWSIFDPRVWPVLIALSFGQVVGTVSFVLYLLAIFRDLRIGKRLFGEEGSESSR